LREGARSGNSEAPERLRLMTVAIVKDGRRETLGAGNLRFEGTPAIT
jgi:hypothetical protein